MSNETTQRIGLLGGTFNPVHHGHLLLAQNAFDTYELSQVLFIPCARPPHKDDAFLLSGTQRREMLDAALSGDPRFDVCDIELKRGGVSYAIDTLQEMEEQYPGAELFFIIGDDTLRELHTWHRIYDLLPLCTFVTFSRDTDPAALRPETLQLDPPWGQRLLRHASFGRRIEISSSDIRHRVAEGMSVRYLVPDAVDMYIAEHGLYQS